MAAHTWELAAKQPRNDRYRHYTCTRCGKGPIQKDVFDDKSSMLDAAKKAGIEPDCYEQIAKDIHES
jgi:hypothetical protein